MPRAAVARGVATILMRSTGRTRQLRRGRSRMLPLGGRSEVATPITVVLRRRRGSSIASHPPQRQEKTRVPVEYSTCKIQRWRSFSLTRQPVKEFKRPYHENEQCYTFLLRCVGVLFYLIVMTMTIGMELYGRAVIATGVMVWWMLRWYETDTEK